jgi:hypothetical protein
MLEPIVNFIGKEPLFRRGWYLYVGGGGWEGELFGGNNSEQLGDWGWMV